MNTNQVTNLTNLTNRDANHYQIRIAKLLAKGETVNAALIQKAKRNLRKVSE